MNVGVLEGLDMVPTNRHLRDILRLKGYSVDYFEYACGHDRTCWRGTLADGLISLIGNAGARKAAIVP